MTDTENAEQQIEELRAALRRYGKSFEKLHAKLKQVSQERDILRSLIVDIHTTAAQGSWKDLHESPLREVESGSGRGLVGR